MFTTTDEPARVGVRIGDQVVDLAPVAAGDMLEISHVFESPSLNPLLELGRPAWSSVRSWLTGLLTDETERDLVEPHLVPVDDVTLLMPFEVADYVDFYCSLDHASNVGRIFRPDDEPLKPNWRHLPVGYHGRAGHRRRLRHRRPASARPAGLDRRGHPAEFGPSRRLDIEAELGFVVGGATRIGEPVGVDALRRPRLRGHAAQRLVGARHPGLGVRPARPVPGQVVRDLGQRLGHPARRRSTPPGSTCPDSTRSRWTTCGSGERAGFDVDIEVVLNGETVSRPPYASMYWSPAQMLAHLTVNGASLRPGDLFASGTVSGPEPGQRGSFLELSWGGTEPFGDGRTFLEDGDTVTLRATAPGTAGGRIALGEVTGTVTPATRAPK